MTSRITVLAIQEAAHCGDMETLAALLDSYENILPTLSPEEARAALQTLEQAERLLRVQMKDVQRELGGIRQKGRGLKQYKSAA